MSDNCEKYDAERLLQRVYKQLNDLADCSDGEVDVKEVVHIIETIEVNRPRKEPDEDTAGDSVQSDYTETGDSVQRENTELEPAACKVIREDGYSPDVYGTTWIPASAVEEDDEILESAVRLSDVIAIIEEHRDRYEERRKKAFDNYMQAESEKNRRVHQSVAAQNQDRVTILDELLEEFTHGESGE